MKTRLVKIGNSQGVRIPRSLIEAAGLESEIDMELEADAIVLRRPKKARTGWDDAFRNSVWTARPSRQHRLGVG